MPINILQPPAVFLFVSCERIDGCLIEVRDQGVGILPEDRERVFDDFYRGQNVGGQRGMGLGLGIARDAARRLGGVIELADSHQTGTTVTIKIPFADQ
jgi:signal transduction histidine kinase